MIRHLLPLLLFAQYIPAGSHSTSTSPAPVFRGTSQASTNNATTVVVPLPTGSLSGDLAVIFCNSAFNLSAISGWTTIVLDNGHVWNTYVGSKVLTSGDITTGSATCTAGGSDDMPGAMVTFVGGTSGVRENQSTGSTNTTGATLSTTGAVISTDTGIYWNSIRQQPSATVTITAGSGTLTTLQTITTTGATASSSLLVGQRMAGGAQTNTYGFTGAGGSYEGVQVIVETP